MTSALLHRWTLGRGFVTRTPPAQRSLTPPALAGGVPSEAVKAIDDRGCVNVICGV